MQTPTSAVKGSGGQPSTPKTSGQASQQHGSCPRCCSRKYLSRKLHESNGVAAKRTVGKAVAYLKTKIVEERTKVDNEELISILQNVLKMLRAN